MSLLEELAGNRAKARAAAKELNVAQLENLIAGLSNALEKMKEDEALRAQEEAEKARRAEEIAKLIAESGLTLDEITTLTTVKAGNPIKGKSVAPKYHIEWEGETHEWTGRGRTPKVFEAYFASGKTREDAEI